MPSFCELSLQITGVPEGATLSAGLFDTETGTYTLTPEQLDGLTLTSPPGDSQDFTLNVKAIVTDYEPGDEFDDHTSTVIVEDTLDVNVFESADTPTLVLADNVGYEDNAIPVFIDSELTDIASPGEEGVETLSITISGVPEGATLSAGTDNGDGSWTLTPDQLTDLTVTPPADSNVDFDLTVTATSTVVEGGEVIDTAENVGTVHIDVIGVADRPDLETADAAGAINNPIALDIDAGLVDTDGSETLTINISNVPDGAAILVGGNEIAPDDDGSYTLTPDQVADVSVMPPADSDGDFTLHVVAKAEENDGDVALNSSVINVIVDTDFAEPPILVIDNAAGFEDNAIPLGIDASITDPGDMLTITISDIPPGATLNAGSLNPDGSVTLTPEQLDGLTITPPEDSNVDFDLSITATAIDGDATAETTGTLSVDVLGVADTPTLFTADAAGDVGEPIPLDITSGLTDTDGSETLSITITGLPEGASLNNGTVNPDGSVTLTPEELNGLELTPPAGSDTDFQLTVTATATDVEPAGEGPHTDTASRVGTIDVDLSSNAEPPVLVLDDAQGYEDTAIPLDIDAAITDAGDVLSITIADVPPGTTLSAGTDNGDGTWSLDPDQLDGLTITPPADSNVDFDLTVTATATDGSDVETTTDIFTVDVIGVADAPTLQTEDVSGDSGEPIPLDIASGLTDTDGSESLSITISGLPEGASLNNGTVNPDGSVTLTPAELNGLVLTPPAGSDEDFTLAVTATSTEDDGDTADTLGTINVDLSDNAEPPTLVLTDAQGDEDTAIPLDIDAAITDAGDVLSITISEVPQGATLSAGTDNGDGSWSLTPEQLDGLTVTPPADSDVDFALTVTATATDGSDVEHTTGTLNVVVDAVADTPAVDAGDGDGDVGQTIPLDISSALADTDGSESLSITISDVPEGAVINGGEQVDDGTWLLEPGDLANLTISLPADASDDFDLTVTATATEADGGDTATNTVTSSVNVDPNAADDVNEATAGNSAAGNVITGLGDVVDPEGAADTGSQDGPNTITEVTFGDTTVSFDDPGAVQSDDNGNFVTIEGDHGSLKMYEDGDYEYTADEGGTGETDMAGLTGTASPDAVEEAWSGVETFAFDFGTSMLDENGQFDPSLADDTVTFTSRGLGVAGTEDGMPAPDQINHNELTGESEALGINLGSEASTAAVQLSNLFVNEDGGEQGRWQAFDADGNLVGEGVIDASTVDYDGSSNVGTVNIDTGGEGFQYLVFSATDTANDSNPNDSSDFFVRSIEFESGGINEGQDVFSYTMSDADGDTASANLTINVDGGDVTAEALELVVTDATGDEDTGIPLAIDADLVDTDGSETLSITISDVPQGATLSAGTDNGDGSWTLAPADLDGLTLRVPEGIDDFDLSVSATSTENDGDTATVSTTVSVETDTEASDPTLETTDAAGLEDTAIALNIDAALTDTDGSETLSVTIAGVPAGASLSAGTDNGDGSWTLGPDQLDGLTITPPANSNVEFSLQVTATTTETSSGDTATQTATIDVDVTGVADAATAIAQDDSGNEDQWIQLHLDSAMSGDTDGSETLSITITGVPEGAQLNPGTDLGDGTWSATATELPLVCILPPEDFSGDINMTLHVTTTENDGDSFTVSEDFTVSVAGVADTPDLSIEVGEGTLVTEPGEGGEGGEGGGDVVVGATYSLAIVAATTDIDGSEDLSITIGGLPQGVELSAGTDNGDGTWSLEPDEVEGLSLFVPTDVSTDFEITVTAISTEPDSGDTATHAENVGVDLIDIPEDVEGMEIDGTNSHDHLVGGASDDVIDANKGNDVVEAGAGDDHVRGEGGHDTIDGGAGDDVLYGHGGSDIIEGGTGADAIFGGGGHDTLFGGDGADVIDGGKKNDIIEGGAGDDILTGGSGTDTFVFDAESGNDIITDIFEQDTLVFEGQEFNMDDLVLSENEEGDVVVSFQGVDDTSVILEGVSMENINSDDGAGYSVSEDDGKVSITIDNIE